MSENIKLLVISDIHGHLEAIDKLKKCLMDKHYEIFIICGDLTHFGSPNELKEVLYALSNAVSYDLMVFVLGNCDPYTVLEDKNLCSDMSACRLLHGDVVLWHDIAIGGVGGGLISPFGTLIEYDEDEFSAFLDSIMRKWVSTKTRILVTHTPPYNTKVDLTHFGEHIGSLALRNFILKEAPLLNLCGHVHEARGIDRLGESYIVNPGPLRKGYYADVIIRRREGKIKINLKEVK